MNKGVEMSKIIKKMTRIIDCFRSLVLEYSINKLIRLLIRIILLCLCSFYLCSVIIEDLSWIADLPLRSILFYSFIVSLPLPLLSAIIAWLISTLKKNYGRVIRQPSRRVFRYKLFLFIMCFFLVSMVGLLVFHKEVLHLFVHEIEYDPHLARAPIVVASILLVTIVLVMIFLFFAFLEINNFDYEDHKLN